MLSWKQNALGLNLRNIRISLRDFFLEFYNFIYYIQPFKIYDLVSMKESSHKYINDSLGKNLS